MLYQSTRNSDIRVTSAEAIVKGLSADGGLYVPEQLPQITIEEIDALTGKNYQERAKFIISKFLTDFSMEEIDICVRGAYNCRSFSCDEIAPVVPLTETASVLELWHGPTCAFKDMALQILPYFMTYSIKKCNIDKKIIILVATSGDTGKAALEGFADVDGTGILVFFPEDGVSKIQKLQMLTQEGNNVGVASVYGNFDDAQTGVKKIFSDKEYAQKLSENGFMLSSANSINWGRLLPQIVYYFSAYCDMVNLEKIKLGDKINICVPTGNFGNILAAWYGKKMGLPVNKFICASNSNNVLTDFISTGIYNKNRAFTTTISPSMDILISSNLERLLYDITKDANKVKGYMQELAENGRYEVDESVKNEIKANFFGGYCDDKSTADSIKSIFDEYGYLLDTHTAVAFNVYEQYKAATGDCTPSVIASTANPYKFNGAVLCAIKPDTDISEMDEFDVLYKLNEVSEMNIPASLAGLKNKKQRFDRKCEKQDMIKVVDEMLGIK